MYKWLIRVGIPLLSVLGGTTIWGVYLDYFSISEAVPYPDQLTLNVGDFKKPYIDLKSPKGRIIKYSEKIIWNNDTNGIVSVDEDGKITALQKGEAIVTFQLCGASGNIFITVKETIKDGNYEAVTVINDPCIKNDIQQFELPTKFAQIGIYPQTSMQSNCSSMLKGLILNANISISPRKTKRKSTIVRYFSEKEKVVKAANMISTKLKQLGIAATTDPYKLNFWNDLRTDDERIEIWFGTDN